MKNCSSFIDSFAFDKRLAVYDIAGSVAHVKMLVKCRIIPSADGAAIIAGLAAILADVKKGKGVAAQEDIHYAIEKELIRR
ncbi:MAG: argininosuccinate lyase, partial [Elusimicrobiota bacterium]